MLTALFAGLSLGLSLIVAIGAQNLFVLRQGLRREHVVAVASVCAASDALLIALGVSGMGAAVGTAPWLVETVRWLGAAFLVTYGALAARRAWRPAGEAMDPGASAAPNGRTAARDANVGRVATAPRTRLAPVLLTCLALTWLNPHVYLDTVFLLGGIASTHGAERWWFALGAVCGSVVWFFALALGARHLGRWLSTRRAWRILDAVIAIVMIALAIMLVRPA